MHKLSDGPALMQSSNYNGTASQDMVPPPVVIGVLGAKGGVGATTTAVNTAAVLSQINTAVTLLDANLQQPDLAVMLALEPEYTLLDLARIGDSVDLRAYEACRICLGDSKRLALLTPPLNGDAQPRITLTEIASCLSSLKSLSPVWLIDLPRHLDRHLVTLLDQCDILALVFEATITGVAAAARWLRTFRDLGYAQEKILCVLNRAGSKLKAVEREIESTLPNQAIFRVANAFILSERSCQGAAPVVFQFPHKEYARDIRALSLALMDRASKMSLLRSRLDEQRPAVL